MFRAIRNWWLDGRGKPTARLFAFEFVVVVLGVLTAQGLANWMQDRSEDRALHEENERVRYEIGRARNTARIWLAATPCLTERVERIVRSVGERQSSAQPEIAMPRFIGYRVERMSDEMRRKFLLRYGVSVVDTYALLSGASANLTESYVAMQGEWDSFALLDPALGRASDNDMAEVRKAGVLVLAKLRRIRQRAEMIESSAAILGIAPRRSDAVGGAVAPISACGEIWRTGRIWRDVQP